MKVETKLIKTKLGLLHLAEQLDNVTQACCQAGCYMQFFVFGIFEILRSFKVSIYVDSIIF